MEIILYVIMISIITAVEWIQDVETQKLYVCDRIVGEYYDLNKAGIQDTFSLYDQDQRENLVLNHFFYMMNNCVKELRDRFPDSTIDDFLIQELDWLEIIKPQQFQVDERDLSNLTIEEMEIRSRMHAEKQLILENLERNQSKFTQFLRAWNLNEQSISIYAIIIIMAIFFYNLIKAMKFMISEYIKDEEKQNRKQKKKY